MPCSDADGKPAATVEAKKLGETLSPFAGCRCSITRSRPAVYVRRPDRWRPLASCPAFSMPVPLDEKRKLEVSIANTPAQEIALRLLLLWRPNLAFRQSGTRPTHRFSVTVRRNRRRPKSNQSQPRTDPPCPNRCHRDRLRTQEYKLPVGTPCPSAIRIWDGSEQTLQYWYEILTGVVKTLHSEGRLTIEDVPIGFSPKTYSEHTEPVHPSGETSANAKWVEGTPFVVNANLNAGQVRANTKNLLKRFDRNPAEVNLRATR